MLCPFSFFSKTKYTFISIIFSFLIININNISYAENSYHFRNNTSNNK